MQVRVLRDADAGAEKAAEMIVAEARSAVSARPKCLAGLSEVGA